MNAAPYAIPTSSARRPRRPRTARVSPSTAGTTSQDRANGSNAVAAAAPLRAATSVRSARFTDAPRVGPGEGGGPGRGSRPGSTPNLPNRPRTPRRSGALRTDDAQAGCLSRHRCLLGAGPFRRSNPVAGRPAHGRLRPPSIVEPDRVTQTSERGARLRPARWTTRTLPTPAGSRQPLPDQQFRAKAQVRAGVRRRRSFYLPACRSRHAVRAPPRRRWRWWRPAGRRAARRPRRPGRGDRAPPRAARSPSPGTVSPPG